MHRHVREHLEEVLADPSSQSSKSKDIDASQHLAACGECRDEVKAMREQANLLRQWRAPEEVSPRAGFYARVLERIEAEGPGSIWSLFFESTFGRRLAIASLALAALLCVVLVSTEKLAEVAEQSVPFAPYLQGQVVLGEDQPGVVLTGDVDSAPDQDSVLVNLVTYREQ